MEIYFHQRDASWGVLILHMEISQENGDMNDENRNGSNQLSQNPIKIFPFYKICENITEELVKNPLSMLFLRPFKSADKTMMANYMAKIKEPMDLSLVTKKLKSGSYNNYLEWKEDMLLIFQNAINFNQVTSLLGGISIYLKKKFLQRIEEIEIANIRTYEDKLIKASKKLGNLLECVPEECCLIKNFDNVSPELNDFSFSRFHGLAESLNTITKNGFGEEIYRVLENTDPRFKDDPDYKVDLSKLSRHALLSLESYAVNKLGQLAKIAKLQEMQSMYNSRMIQSDEIVKSPNTISSPISPANETNAIGTSNTVSSVCASTEEDQNDEEVIPQSS